MDFETGEVSESYDTETGENIDTSDSTYDSEISEIPYSPLDEETGENRDCLWSWPPKRFKVPRSFYTPSSKKRNYKKRQNLRKADQQESELITAVIFLLPTMIFFHPILYVVVTVVEIILHNWSHKKNRKLKKDAIYFHRSPLHGISKEFCGRCKEDMAENKIIKIQDRKINRFRKYQLEYLKRVVT